MRSRARWVRYLRACPPSRLSDLPSQMITAGQRRRGRARARVERLARLRPQIPTTPKRGTLTETEPRKPPGISGRMAPVVESPGANPGRALRLEQPAEADSPAGAGVPALPAPPR